MCLSDAYEIRDGKENLVCSRVCNVSADGENVTLTDLMGIRKVIPGKLKKVDLMSNVILEGMPEDLDCASCSFKPVCDEVEGLKELHFGKAAKKEHHA